MLKLNASILYNAKYSFVGFVELRTNVYFHYFFIHKTGKCNNKMEIFSKKKHVFFKDWNTTSKPDFDQTLKF